MESSAIERELLRGSSNENYRTNWGHVQRIIHRQTSSRTLKESLERIVEEFDLPFELLILVVTKVHDAPGLSSSLFRCIRNIWRRVLVDRGENAFRFFDRLRQEPGPIHAQREYTKELFAIQSRQDLIQNQIFLQAFKKTKYLIQTIQKYDPRTLPPTVSLLHALVHANMPPFLILLAARDEPDSIMKRDLSTAKLPLHLAMDARRACQRLVSPYRMRFILAKEDVVDGGSNHYLLSLLNRPSPVQLLCHLYPPAGSKADQSPGDRRYFDERCFLGCGDGGHTPFETFLYTMEIVPWYVKHCELSWNHVTKILLHDLQTVARLAPQTLDTRNRHHHLFPFMIPMLHWNSLDSDTLSTTTSTNSTTRDDDDDSGHNFLLTVSYTLLKENPMVLQHCYQSENVVIEPSTAYGKVLKQRITRLDQQIDEAMHRHEELKRRIAQLEQENAVLLQENDEETRSSRAAKRLKPTSAETVATSAPS